MLQLLETCGIFGSVYNPSASSDASTLLLAAMLYTAASDFQQVMRLVKHWWLRSFENMLVDGQLALTYDDKHQAQGLI